MRAMAALWLVAAFLSLSGPEVFFYGVAALALLLSILSLVWGWRNRQDLNTILESGSKVVAEVVEVVGAVDEQINRDG